VTVRDRNSQQLAWGSVSWIEEPRLDESRASVALVTLDPFACIPGHTHHGLAQVLYVLSGRGRIVIDGREHPLRPGVLRKDPPGNLHTVENLTADPLTMITVRTQSEDLAMRYGLAGAEPCERGRAATGQADARRVGWFQERLWAVLQLQVMMLRDSGEAMTPPTGRPGFCRLICSEGAGRRLCRQHLERALRPAAVSGRPSIGQCCPTLHLLVVPCDAYDGFLAVGPVRLQLEGQDALAELLNVLGSTCLPPALVLAEHAALTMVSKGWLYDALEICRLFTHSRHVLAEPAVDRPATRDPVSWVREYIKARLQDHLTLTGLAGLLGYHPNYLGRIFKQRLGLGFSAYLRRARLARAKVLLRDTHWPVYRVARAVGFKDPNHFTATFSSEIGCSPTQFRRTTADDSGGRRPPRPAPGGGALYGDD